jgi:hypothetical protein
MYEFTESNAHTGEDWSVVSSADAEAAGDGIDVNVLTMEETLQNTGAYMHASEHAYA